MLGIDKTCIRISCGTFLSLIKELNLLRVLEFISGCDGVHASSTNTETVTFTAPYTTLLPKDLAHLPSPTPRGWGTHPSRQGFAGTSYGCPPPPVRPSRAEAVLHFLNELFYFHGSIQTEGFPGASDSKESACNTGDLGLIPGSGRSPGEENGYPFQYSCLENFMDKGAWWATVHGVSKSQTRLSD